MTKISANWRSRPHLILYLILLLAVSWTAMPANAQSDNILDTRITLKKETAQLSAILTLLQQQCRTEFSFDKLDMQKVTVDKVSWENIPLRQALDELKKNTGLTWSLIGRNIAFRIDPPQPSKKKTSRTTLSGKLVDEETASPIQNATVTIGDKTLLTEMDGSFSISLPPGRYKAIVSSVGYIKKEVTDILIEDQIIFPLSIVLKRSKGQLTDVIVTATAHRENTATLLLERQKNIRFTDGISADVIRRTPDRNAGESMKRITGASVLEGKFVVVRGLADRYNYTLLNGSLLPSTEPDRRTFSLDLIPAQAIESIVISKTTTAENPGEFAGGIVQINTKEFPEQNFVNLAITGGYYQGVTGKPFYADHLGSRDWIGSDDGGRAIPAVFNRSAAQLSQLYAEERLSYSSALAKGWKPQLIGNAAPTWQGQLGLGHTFRLPNGHMLGIVAQLNYRKDQTIDQVQRYDFPYLVPEPGDSIPGFFRSYPYERDYHYLVNLGGMLNIAYRFRRNRITVKTLYNRDLDNTTIIKEGEGYDGSAGAMTRNIARKKMVDMHLEQKTLTAFQLQGEHRFQDENSAVLTWNLGYNKIRKYEPGQTRQGYTNYYLSDTVRFGDYYFPDFGSLENASRLFTNLEEKAYNLHFAIAAPFRIAGQQQLFKAGSYTQFRRRSFATTNLGYMDADRAIGLSTPNRVVIDKDHQDIESLLVPANFRPGGFVVVSYEYPANQYQAASNLASGFINMESNILDNLKLIYGGRVEFFTMNLSTNKDLQRILPGNSSPGSGQEPIDYIRYTNNFLPSASLIYNPIPAMNIRAAYSKTLTRPEFREVSPYEYFDFVTGFRTMGNPDLTAGYIKNYDARVEYFPAPGEIFSASVFRKDLRNPVEIVTVPVSDDPTRSARRFVNIDKAVNEGYELEARKSLWFGTGPEWLKNILLFANYTRIWSTVTGIVNNSTGKPNQRPMMGQSPYLINAGLLVNALKNTFSFSAVYNRVGRRIVITGRTLTDAFSDSYPDIYENPRNQLDIQVSQKLFHRHLELRVNAANLINNDYIEYQDYDRNGKYSGTTFDALPYIRKSYRNFTFTISYNFN